MNKIKQLIMFVALVAAGLSASAQMRIPGTNVQFRLNADDWRYMRTFEMGDGGVVYL